MCMYIGIDIGGTKTLVASADLEAKIVSQQKIATPGKVEIAQEAIVDLVHAVARNSDIKAIGVAAPGPIDWENGAIGKAANIPWRHLEIIKVLEKHFRAPVVLENDANTAALAEARLGSGAGFDPVLYVGIGTGVGTGLVSKGQIYRGAFDVEGGHMIIDPNGEKCGCGGVGHWETIVSGPAFHKRFGQQPAEVKDPKVWDEYAKDLAHGLVNLCAAVSPGVIVLGGGVGTHLDSFKQPLEKYLDEQYRLYPTPEIKAAKYPETASVFGAILLAKSAQDHKSA